MTVHVANAKGEIATARLGVWCRILDAVAEQREALDFRICRAEPGDTHLEADVRTWRDLSVALADLLDARRAA